MKLQHTQKTIKMWAEWCVKFHSILAQMWRSVLFCSAFSVYHTGPCLLSSCHEFKFLIDLCMLEQNGSIFWFAYLVLTSVQTFCGRWKVILITTASMTAIIAFQNKHVNKRGKRWKISLGIGSIFYIVHYFKICGFLSNLYNEINTNVLAESMEEYKIYILLDCQYVKLKIEGPAICSPSSTNPGKAKISVSTPGGMAG